MNWLNVAATVLGYWTALALIVAGSWAVGSALLTKIDARRCPTVDPLSMRQMERLVKELDTYQQGERR